MAFVYDIVAVNTQNGQITEVALVDRNNSHGHTTLKVEDLLNALRINPINPTPREGASDEYYLNGERVILTFGTAHGKKIKGIKNLKYITDLK